MRRVEGRLVRRLALVLLLMVAASGWLVAFERPEAGRERAAVEILVAGKREEVAPGTTLAEAASRFRLRPRAGDLVDVKGRTLRRARFPGLVLLNGRRASASTKLATGDRLSVLDGRNRTEATPLLSTKAVAEHCGVSYWTARTWIESGKLKCLRLPGRLIRVRLADLQSFLEACG